MKAPRKVLYIKNRSEGKFARSWVVEELGTHGRIIGDAALLEKVLAAESFDIIVLDQRGGTAELIPSIEAAHQVQPAAKLVVVGENVALTDVRLAMRFGVNDIFTPPFQLFPIVERVDALVAQVAGTRATATEAMYFRWSELAATLNGQLDAIFAQVNTGPAQAEASASTEPDWKAMSQQQATELEALRAQLVEASEARARLADQVTQLSAGASALGRVESRARSLEAEIAELRRTGAGGIDIGPIRDELEKAHARIAELEHLTNGLLAGNGEGDAANRSDSSEVEERVRVLEAELADANARFEAAGQAFATEMEQVMAREAEAMAALAAAEDRERKANAVMATAGDAFGRADETLEKERTALRVLRDEIEEARAAVEQERKALAQREARLADRNRRVDSLSRQFAGDVENTIASLGALTEHAHALLQRREEIKSLTERGGA
jgi:DNA repair exonuclease SbcCD ATPase subunit